MTLSRPVRTPDQVLAAALRSLHEDGWDGPTRRYAEDAWAGHELASGDASGAVKALIAVSSPLAPSASRDRWQQYLEPVRSLLGADHPDTLTTRHNLADWRGEAGDPAGAAEAFAELVPIVERMLGADHPDTLTARSNLAYWRGEADGAAGVAGAFAELLPLRERVLGADHPHTLATRGSLAHWRGEAGDAAGAAEAFAKLLFLCERVLGADHPNTLTVRYKTRLLESPRTDQGWRIGTRGANTR